MCWHRQGLLDQRPERATNVKPCPCPSPGPLPGKHVVWTDLRGFSALAVNTLVGPIRSRQALIAPGWASTRAQMGPLVMNSTSLGKNGLP